MKKSIMASKGTPQQFAAALQNKIAELGGGVEDINSSTSITAASESYKDTSGIMGIPGEIWTTAELSEYWNNEQMDDPVMSEYDSFESWFSDTVSQMELIDASTNIEAASEGDDSQYIQELAQKAAQQASEDSGWSVTHNIAGGMISFVVSDGTQQLGTYIQPVGEIYPDWAELDDDVQQLASEILGQVEPNMGGMVDGSIDPEVGSPTL